MGSSLVEVSSHCSMTKMGYSQSSPTSVLVFKVQSCIFVNKQVSLSALCVVSDCAADMPAGLG